MQFSAALYEVFPSPLPPSPLVPSPPFSAEDVQSIVTGKLALKYAGVQIEAIQNIATASKNRSIAEFEKVKYCIKEGGSLQGFFL